ncbi:MAG: hypothetical protein RL522_2432 [Pseudomonadota bacterium]
MVAPIQLSDAIPPEPASAASQREDIQEAWLTSSTPSLVALAAGATHALLATNAAFEAFFGWKWGDPRTLLNLFHFEEGEGLAGLSEAVLRTGTTASAHALAVRVADPSGAYSAKILMDFTCSPMRLSDGKTPAVLVHARMSSPPVKMLVPRATADALIPFPQVPSMDQDRLALALEAVKMGVWEWNPISGITVWNSQMYLLFGMPVQGVEPTIEIFMGAVHPADRAAMSSRLAECVAGKAEFSIEFRVVRADTGEERWLASRGRARFGADGKAVVLHGVSFDITDRVRNEQRLRSISLRRAEFLAVLGHELRNPLAPLLYLATAMESSTASSAESVRAAQVIKRQVLQLTRLVDDLLEVSRIEQGKIELRRKLIAVDDAVKDAVEAVLPGIWRRHQQLETRIAPGLMLEADHARLTQVISNLLNNASKFTQEGGQIEVNAHQEGEMVRIVVRDNGPGIEPGVLDTMFEPFTQGRITLDRSQGGLGVGLSIVKKIVELHGGTVLVSTSPQGTAFTVSLPSSPPVPAVPGVPVAGDLAGQAAIRRLKFLVVEDNLDAARMLAEFVQIVGHEVLVAHDGEEGIAMARQHHPDVILMDIGLPKLDGWAAAANLRADASFKDTVMIAMSGYCQPSDYQRSLRAGFDLHLSKPPDLAEVFRYLEARHMEVASPQG